MLGSGVFINNVTLAKSAGPLSILSYPLVGLTLIPLVLIFSLLLNRCPGATFYEIGAQVHPILGFISSWGYFIGKLASAALGVHISVTTAQLLIPAFACFNPLIIDSGVLILFLLLNLFNIKTERPMQYLFVTLKSIPVLIIISCGIALLNPLNLSFAGTSAASIFSTVPFVIYGFAGFEASCSLAKNIKNPSRNGPLAIMLSFALVLTAVSLFQLSLVGALGANYENFATFQQPIHALITNTFSTQMFAQKVFITVIFLGIASSALGSSYSILYSDVWNLHALAGYRVVPYAHILQKLNRFSAPSACIIIATILTFTYLFSSRGNVVPLQQISACATAITYSVSVMAFLRLAFGQLKRYRFIGLLGAGSCLLFLSTAIINAQKFGVIPYFVLIIGIFIGLLLRATISRKESEAPYPTPEAL